jgi:hypothetical protein
LTYGSSYDYLTNFIISFTYHRPQERDVAGKDAAAEGADTTRFRKE